MGFIRKLPHHLIEAFRSTLEEAKYADIILHVVDVSNPQVEKQMYVVYETLADLGIAGKTIITLFNKQDRMDTPVNIRDFKADKTLKISAKTGEGLEQLKETLDEVLHERHMLLERVFPYEKAGLIALIREQGGLISEDYRENGIYVKAYVPKELYARVSG